MSSASQLQIQLLTTQNQALQCLLEKKPSPNLLPLQPSSQPPPILTTSQSSRCSTLPVDVGCNDLTHSDGIDLRLQKLNEFLSENSTEAESEIPPVSQEEIDTLNKAFRLDNDLVNTVKLKQLPEKLAKRFSSKQGSDLIYKLAVAVQKKKDGISDERYLYKPKFCFRHAHAYAHNFSTHTQCSINRTLM